MKISIAMATYNGGKFLEAQLDSFSRQTRPPDELVVCDDGSSDATWQILNSFAKSVPFEVRLVCNDVNLGHTRNFEKALSLCTGDIIFLSDQDDVWFDEKISVVCAFAMGQTRLPPLVINDAVYADAMLNRQNMTIVQKVRQASGRRHIPVNGACSAISRAFRDFLVPFPADLRTDHDTYIHRWAELVHGRHLVDTVLQVWRIHGNNVTSNEMSDSGRVSILRLYRKYRAADSVDDYTAASSDLQSMLDMTQLRSDALRALTCPAHSPSPAETIRRSSKAHERRIALLRSNFIMRRIRAMCMAVQFDYRFFRGYKSFIKDMLR